MSLDHWSQADTGSGNGLSVVRQQAITWANVDPDLCRHMALLGNNESTTCYKGNVIGDGMTDRRTH